MTAIVDWIRPWYPAGTEAHLSPDCEHLLAVEPAPREGSGWFSLRDNAVCLPCLDKHGYRSWHAECTTCGADACDDFTSQPYISEADAKQWKYEHECSPSVAVEAPPQHTPAQPAGQGTLFVLEPTP